jgi:hypothetical protein
MDICAYRISLFLPSKRRGIDIEKIKVWPEGYQLFEAWKRTYEASTAVL